MIRNRFFQIILLGGLLAAVVKGQSPHTLPADLANPGTPTLIARTGGGGATVFGEGVVADWQGNVYFNEQGTSNRTMQLKVGQDTAHFWRQASDNPNGMWLDPENHIVICQTRALVRVKAGASYDNQTDTLYKYPSTGQDINDVTGDSHGNMYFTNFNGRTVYFRNVTTGETKTLLSNLPQPNGIEWDEERKRVYVNEYGAGKVTVYDVGADFSLTNRKEVASVLSADGITLDTAGNIYVVAGGQSIQVFTPDNRKLGEIPLPNVSLTNVGFGGADFKTLFLITNKGLYKVPMKVRGYKTGQSAAASIQRLKSRKGIASDLSSFFPLNWTLLGRLKP
jgi:gluconolactonase